MDVRQRTEEIEHMTFAPWATFSDQSRGRMLPEEQDPIRPVFQRDRDRVLHSPEAVVYSPKELMEMDWLDECVEGALPHYDELDVKTHVLMAINGLNTLKGFVK